MMNSNDLTICHYFDVARFFSENLLSLSDRLDSGEQLKYKSIVFIVFHTEFLIVP